MAAMSPPSWDRSRGSNVANQVRRSAFRSIRPIESRLHLRADPPMRPPMPAYAPVLGAVLALAAAAGPAAAQPESIAPGYWETTNQVVTPMRSTKVERRCILPKDVAKFMEGP